MTNGKHTPGPWTWNSGENLIAGGLLVNGSNRSPEVRQANRALIASAPALLEALEAIVRCADEAECAKDFGLSGASLIARKAIASARGEAAGPEGGRR